MDGSVNEDRVPSSTRISSESWGEQSERKNEQIPLFFPLRRSGPAAGTSPPSLTSKVLLFILPTESAARDYILPVAAVPSGAAQARRHATRRVRSEIFKLSLGPARVTSHCSQYVLQRRQAGVVGPGWGIASLLVLLRLSDVTRPRRPLAAEAAQNVGADGGLGDGQ